MANGAFWLDDSPQEVVPGDLRITGGVVSLIGGGSLIGEWPEAAVELIRASGMLRLTAEGETIVFRPASPADAAELGIESDVRSRIQAAQLAASPGAIPSQSHDPTRQMSDRTAGIVAGNQEVVAASAETRKNSIFLMIVGGLIGLGSFMPWARLGFFSMAGTEGDGLFTLIGGAALLGIGFFERKSEFSRIRRVIAFLISGLCAWISWSAFATVSDGGIDAHLIGGGLVVVVFSSAFAVVATFFWMFEKEPSE